MRTLKPFAAVAAYSVVAGAMSLTPLAAAIAAERDTSGTIEEIIVTTRRTEESLQDVPVSVTAFQQADMDRIAPKTLRDLDGLSPNVFIGMNTAGPGAGAIFIRGLGYADIEKTQSSAVGVIVDGVFQASSTVGQLVDTFDVEQVEINRGPQGVLFGKNTTGGTIVVNRTKPSTERFGFKAAVQNGSYDEHVYKARVNIPLSDTLAVKLGGIQRDSDGFYENDTRGGRVGAVDYKSYTASALWEPTDSFSAQFTYDFIRDEGDIPPQDPRFDGKDPFHNLADMDEFQFADVDSYALQLGWDTDYGTLTSITALVESTDTVRQDFDGATRDSSTVVNGVIVVPNPLAQLHTLRDQDYSSFTQELRWAGDINDQWSYQVGAYYMETGLNFQQGTNQVVQVPIPDPTPNTPCEIQLNSPAPCYVQVGPLYSVQLSEENTESRGYFGNVTWQVTDQLEVSAGARYIEDEKEFKTSFWRGDPASGSAILPPTQPLGNLPNLFVPMQDDDWNDTIMKVSATYSITDTSNVYASFAQGFRSGGFSMRGIIPEQLPYDPENVDTWELGSKNEFLDGRMRLNLSAFINTLQDAQFSSVLTDNYTPGSPGTNTVVNNANGDIEIWGIEAEMTALLTDYLTLIVTGGYQKDDSEEFQISSTRVAYNPNGSACNPVNNPTLYPDACPAVTVGGGALARTPEWNWSTTLVYGQEIGADYLEASVTARGQDDWVISGGATSLNPEYEEGYTLVDARVAYEHKLSGKEDTVVLSLVGKNLTDEEYREQTLPLGNGGGFQGWAPPLTWAVELVYNH